MGPAVAVVGSAVAAVGSAVVATLVDSGVLLVIRVDSVEAGFEVGSVVTRSGSGLGSVEAVFAVGFVVMVPVVRFVVTGSVVGFGVGFVVKVPVVGFVVTGSVVGFAVGFVVMVPVVGFVVTGSVVGFGVRTLGCIVASVSSSSPVEGGSVFAGKK